ncbi:MAG: rhomboid family intramembrane serine protease [Legionellales bacterium RIFCSPHIGHO2_12_FULL_42_9]|nr:MAG: rhomboid family intramembrane serine protease [Legionellales bacterium RIFCSPHIGHO2_12_FULL_42_9]
MLNQLNASLTLIISQTQANWIILAKIIALPWLIYFLNFFVHHRLLYLGIIPRHLIGLPGIFFAPLLHANFNHLFFNTIPLLVLSNFILINGLNYFLTVTVYITCLSGFLIWCFAKPGIHIGASALITGYWGLLVSGIYQQGTLMALILGGLSLYYFAGLFSGLFPSRKGVSWEGHVFGLIAGLTVSEVLRF